MSQTTVELVALVFSVTMLESSEPLCGVAPTTAARRRAERTVLEERYSVEELELSEPTFYTEFRVHGF
jgi:hypothetical protein